MDEITVSFPNIETAIQTIGALRDRASNLKAQKPRISVSRGNGTNELNELSSAVSDFASALEKEIIEGINWLKAASAEFKAADEGLANDYSDR